MALPDKEKLYDYLNNEEDARACTDIDEEACRNTPANYFLILSSNSLTKLGDALTNPKTVLTWLMNLVNAPVFLISFIVPIRESGSMLPQLIISAYVRKLEVRKWVWVIGSFLQFLSIASIGLIALNFRGNLAGYLIILALIIFSLSRGLCSISSKDVLGKTIPKKRRGKLKGYTASLSGALVLAVGLFLFFRDEETVHFYSMLVIIAGFLWLIAAVVFSRIKEFPGETDGGSNGIREALNKIRLIKDDKPFRNFVISRSLLLCSALSAPFYVLLAQEHLGAEGRLLAAFIIANGIASIISSPVWGNFADKSSKNVMATAAIITAFTGLVLVALVYFSQGLAENFWLYPIAFFVLGIAHSGVRLGRKTYVVDLAEGNKRTDYVAVSNTLIGLILFLTGGISAIASIWSVKAIIITLSVLGLIGALKSYSLKDVESD